MKGRIVNIKRYEAEGLTSLSISIAGTIKQFNVNDPVEIKKVIKRRKPGKPVHVYYPLDGFGQHLGEHSHPDFFRS